MASSIVAASSVYNYLNTATKSAMKKINVSQQIRQKIIPTFKRSIQKPAPWERETAEDESDSGSPDREVQRQKKYPTSPIQSSNHPGHSEKISIHASLSTPVIGTTPLPAVRESKKIILQGPSRRPILVGARPKKVAPTQTELKAFVDPKEEERKKRIAEQKQKRYEDMERQRRERIEEMHNRRLDEMEKERLRRLKAVEQVRLFEINCFYDVLIRYFSMLTQC